MISLEEGCPVLLLDREKVVDDAFGVRSTVNVVADKDEVVFRGGCEDFDHLLEGIEAAVNVADGKSSHKSGVMLSLSA